MVDTRPAHALYRGWVRHRRLTPRRNDFRYRVFYLYLDLETLDEAFRGRWLWSSRRPNVCWFRRADYLGDPKKPLADEVRRVLTQGLGRPITGPVGVLTNLRTWGYVQNPVSFYYAYEPATGTVDAMIAEVTNTPWGERYAYVLDARAARGPGTSPLATVGFAFRKAFHVSPFFAMDLGYRWRFTPPGERLAVHMENRVDGARVFDATLVLERRPLTGGALARALLRHPFMSGRILLAIYWQALRLWCKGVPFQPHPAKRAAAPPTGPVQR